jgi:hypothetical protein
MNAIEYAGLLNLTGAELFFGHRFPSRFDPLRPGEEGTHGSSEDSAAV